MTQIPIPAQTPTQAPAQTTPTQTPAQSFPEELSAGSSCPALSEALALAIREDLTPLVGQIDREGVYPRAFMQRLGTIGAFSQAVPTGLGGAGRGLAGTIRVIEEVAAECLSTGFCVWCQTVAVWYMQHGQSAALKAGAMQQAMRGERLSATGMSNPMKHFAGIEELRLKATPADGGFTVRGGLPWVSNIDEGGIFGFVAQIAEEGNGLKVGDYLMAMVPGDAPGLTLGDGGRFIALEGSSTANAAFRDVFVPLEGVLAAPCQEYVAQIRPGFVLAQAGFGLGLVRSCLERMRRSNEKTGHVNRYLDDGLEEIEADWHAARERTYALAERLGCGEAPMPPDATREAVACRILASELSLRASQAAMLYAGAAGYRQGSTAERKLREAYFVAVVTPALKHLKKLQADGMGRK